MPSPALLAVINLFTDCPERWQYATFTVESSVLNHIWLAIQHLPFLRTLKIISHCHCCWQTIFWYSSADKPRNSQHPESTCSQLVPWSQLTSISARLSIDNCYELLCAASNFLDCDFRMYSLCLEPSHSMICHSHLRVFKMF